MTSDFILVHKADEVKLLVSAEGITSAEAHADESVAIYVTTWGLVGYKMSIVNKLYSEVRERFPEIADRDINVRIIQQGYHAGHLALEVRVPSDTVLKLISDRCLYRL